MIIRKGADVLERSGPTGASSVVILIPTSIASQEKFIQRDKPLADVALHLAQSLISV